MAAQPNWRKTGFLIFQVAPPVIMFYFVFGRFDIGTALIVIPPMLYSFFRIVGLIYKKNHAPLLRPGLTFAFALAFIAMGNYYAWESKQQLQQIAHSMSEQCNRDGECRLPAGDWQSSKDLPTVYRSQTAGLVPMRLTLTFNETGQTTTSPCVTQNRPPACSTHRYAASGYFHSFHLVRQLEDNNYDVYGGVGQPLVVP